MNEHSSRSHALLRVTVVGRNKETNKKTTGALLLNTLIIDHECMIDHYSLRFFA